MSPMVWLVPALAVLGFAIAWPVTWLLVVVGGRGHGLDSSGATGHFKTLREIPNTGGLAIFLAVAGPVAAALAAVWTFQTQTWTQMGLGAVVEHLNQIKGTTPTALAMLAGMAFLHMLGLIDDRRSLNPWLKLAVQLAVALVIVWMFDVRLLTMLGTGPSIVLTVLWIVVVTNAINFMDNMDGLAAGVSAIAAGLFMAACIVNEQWFIAATLALLIGSLVAFLLFNFPPATIFMGDGGSLVIGFLLAILTVRTTYYDPTRDDYALGGGVYGLFMPLVVLAIPLYDVCTVSFIRLKQRRSPLVGDQQHFSHRLVQRGLSQRGALLVIWSATAVVGIGGIVLGRLEAWQAILVGVQTALVVMMIAVLEYASRRAGARDGVP